MSSASDVTDIEDEEQEQEAPTEQTASERAAVLPVNPLRRRQSVLNQYQLFNTRACYYILLALILLAIWGRLSLLHHPPPPKSKCLSADRWHLDTSALHHSTNYRNYFHTYTPIDAADLLGPHLGFLPLFHKLATQSSHSSLFSSATRSPFTIHLDGHQVLGYGTVHLPITLAFDETSQPRKCTGMKSFDDVPPYNYLDTSPTDGKTRILILENVLYIPTSPSSKISLPQLSLAEPMLSSWLSWDEGSVKTNDGRETISKVKKPIPFKLGGWQFDGVAVENVGGTWVVEGWREAE